MFLIVENELQKEILKNLDLIVFTVRLVLWILDMDSLLNSLK